MFGVNVLSFAQKGTLFSFLFELSILICLKFVKWVLFKGKSLALPFGLLKVLF